jgi:hypothetical protein
MPDPTTIEIEDLRGGWNSSDPAVIADNELAKAENWYYDDQQILTTRNGIDDFGNEVTAATTQHSLYYTQFSNGNRYLLCAMTTATDTTIYKYNESTENWDSLKTGLTSDLRLTFVTFKDEIYWTNGTDNVMSYDGSTVSEHAAVEKGKYLVVFNDVAYMCNISNDPSTVYYTNANPTNLKSSFPNFVVVEEDNGEVITGAQYQAGLLLVGKEKSSYSYEVTGDTLDVLDYSGGVASHRSWKRVDNDTLYLAKGGVFSLVQRRGTTGSLRSIPLTNNLQDTIEGIGDPTISCAYYSETRKNYYLAVDQDAEGRNKGLLVRNTVVGQYKPTAGWTNYTGINVNDIVEYEDADGDIRIIGANVYGGQALELETGFNDQGNEIRCELHFKQFDFGEPSRHKTFPHVDFYGLSSSKTVASFLVSIDGREVAKTFTASSYIDDPAGAKAIGVYPVGMYPVGAGPTGSESDLPTEEFDIRVNASYDSGRRMQPKIEANMTNAKLQLKKITPALIAHQIDVFPTDNII